jgi:hypothetical protein
MAGGRPTKWKPEYAEQAYKLALLGADDARFANFFGVSISGFNKWKVDYPELMESLKAGRDDADCKVVQSLYQKALGGDTTAMIFWLKNRQRFSWRDKVEQEINHTGKIEQIKRTVVDPKGSDA